MAYVFMGSCPFSLAALEVFGQEIDFRAVFTAPPSAKGRGQKIQPTCIQTYAEQKGWPVYTPKTFRDLEAVDLLRHLEPTLVIVASYGLILPKAVLEIPKRGCLNIHPSLLPRWRGACPVTFTLLEGDRLTGVSLMLMDPGVDTGPLLYQETLDVPQKACTPDLSHFLAQKGAHALLSILPAYLEGFIEPIPQNTQGATLTRKITKEDGLLDVSQSAFVLERKTRALQPWPGTWIEIPLGMQTLRLGILKSTPRSFESHNKPGHLFMHDQQCLLTCGEESVLVLEQVRAPSGKVMDGQCFFHGIKRPL